MEIVRKAVMKTFYNYGKTIRTRRVGNSRGDTIVEVLLAVAVLGAVLGSAYVIVNKNIKSSQSSQERLQAIKLAESQYEKLKIYATSNTLVFNSPDFCLTPQNIRKLASDPDCTVDASGVATTADLKYRLLIHRDANVTYGLSTGVRFKLSVMWENVRGSGDDRLDYFYEVYR